MVLKLFRWFFLCVYIFWLAPVQLVQAQVEVGTGGGQENQKEVQVKPSAEDIAISERLTRILNATGWFEKVDVRVREGVVFLSGTADSRDHWEWAEHLAEKTEAVVAVVNNITIKDPDYWSFVPNYYNLTFSIRKISKKLPALILIIFIVLTTWFASKLSVLFVRWVLKFRVKSSLLRGVIARTAVIPVFLLGLYLTLYILGLTRLSMTVIGGTGILGLVVGFAFRDIAENFLASILVSLHHPFFKGDLIEISNYIGYVQGVNSRSTLLLSQEGNLIQIPNATVYKETIINYTANPITRDEFVIGIGYDDSIKQAQAVALEVLKNHDAIVSEPESFIIVSELASATVNLQVLYWFDISKHSRLKVRSSLMQLIKNAYAGAGITMPDDAREVIFPNGVPIHILEDFKELKRKSLSEKKESANEKPLDDDLQSESIEIEEQAKQLPDSHDEGNLL
jgi:small conductance mechanosensitive channel